MPHIDLKHILQSTVSTLYGDLVTRPTGEAVRNGIERALADTEGGQVAVIDFSEVRCLDISCADEIVGKLLLRYGRARNFLLCGVAESHCHAIEQVLERHGLAVVARDRDGRLRVLGPVQDTARRVFGSLCQLGAGGADELARRLSVPPDTARQALNELLARHLVQQSGDGYVALAAQ
ncbi:MAG: hypothetical protein ACE5PT_03330 [Gemmatimonadales bacterium]